MKISRDAWLQSNRAAINARLDWLRDLDDETLYNRSSGNHFVTVTKHGSDLTLWLLDQSRSSSSVVQSEMDLADPLNLVDPYTQAMLLGLLWHPAPDRICCIGLGAGRIPLVLHHFLPGVRLDCVEIDPVVAKAAKDFFAVKTDHRMKVHIVDGREWLAVTEEVYDLILLDVFRGDGCVPYELSTVEFFAQCRQRLRAGGVVVLNLLDGDTLHAERTQSIARVFENLHLCVLYEENTIVLAYDGPRADQQQLIALAKKLKRYHGFAFPFVGHAVALQEPSARAMPGYGDARPLLDNERPSNYDDLLLAP